MNSFILLFKYLWKFVYAWHFAKPQETKRSGTISLPNKLINIKTIIQGIKILFYIISTEFLLTK